MNDKKIPFSKRYGYVPFIPAFQPGVIPQNVRIWFWNFLLKTRKTNSVVILNRNQTSSLSHYLWEDFFKDRLDKFNENTLWSNLENLVLKSEVSHQFIDLVEKVILDTNFTDPLTSVRAYHELEEILVAENTSYRVVNGMVVEVGSSVEADAVVEACKCPFESPKKHIHAALKSLKGTDDDSIRTSIKESISAVEAAFEELVGSRCSSIDGYLKEAEKQKIPIELHK